MPASLCAALSVLACVSPGPLPAASARAQDASARTWQIPAALHMQHSMRPRYQRLLLKGLRHGQPWGRRWLEQWAPMIVVRAHRTGNASTASTVYVNEVNYYELNYDADHLEMPWFRDHAVWHEIGHLVNWSGLTARDERRFTRLFSRSPEWKKCFPYQRGCVPREEIFADQFAFASTGVAQTRTGYHDPPLTTPAKFWKLLRRLYHGDAGRYLGR